MIKINLATKKRAAALDAGGAKAGAKGIRVDADAIKAFAADPRVRKVALAIVVVVLGTSLVNGYENDQLSHLDQQIQQAGVEQAKLNAELAKTAGYDALKKQFDADEELIKTKLATIQKLISDRQIPPKLLAALVGNIPKNVWLTEMSMNAGEVKLKGSSLGFDDITDFMKALGDNEYLSTPTLGDSKKEKTADGTDVATFEIEAKRK